MQVTVSSQSFCPREASSASRSTALLTATTSLPLPHTYVCISPRSQGHSRQASRTLQPVANASRWAMEGSCAASIGHRCLPTQKIAAQPLRCDRAAVSRARQRPHGRLPPRRHAGDAVAGHQPAAATICSQRSPNPAIGRGSVGVSFSSSHKVGSRLKRCLPEVKIRCVLAGRHSPRDIWSTLPARRAGRR